MLAGTTEIAAGDALQMTADSLDAVARAKVLFGEGDVIQGIDADDGGMELFQRGGGDGGKGNPVGDGIAQLGTVGQKLVYERTLADETESLVDGLKVDKEIFLDDTIQDHATGAVGIDRLFLPTRYIDRVLTVGEIVTTTLHVFMVRQDSNIPCARPLYLKEIVWGRYAKGTRFVMILTYRAAF